MHIETQSTEPKAKIRLGFADFCWPMDEFFIDVLSDRFEIIRDDKDPEYLIFCDETFGTSNRRYDPVKVKKIFFTGENRRYKNYDCRYAITFDHTEDSNHYRLPLYVLENWVQINKIGLPDAFQYRQKTSFEGEKIGFCSFVSSNPACMPRNMMFHELSKYKSVASGGPLYNNIGEILPRDGINAQKSKYAFLSKYKFNLCYENGSYPGYVTEKLFHALYAGVVPIYWGSPTVALDFNPRAFISRHNYCSDKEMLEYIKEVDSDDALYNRILAQPILSEYNTVHDLTRLVHWFEHIVYDGD